MHTHTGSNTGQRLTRTLRALAAAVTAAAAAALAAGCHDYLTGGELSNDPNRPSAATNRQLFVGVQTNLWATLASDPARVAGMLVQQFEGTNGQYVSIYHYGITEQQTNGFNAGVYVAGGLRDLRLLQDGARAQGDTLFLGVAQVQEALLVGTAADLFGDVVYSQALAGTPNPPLDPQLDVYDAVQALLSAAITNLSSFGGAATNLGPGSADLSYGGDPAKWVALAHTLKARYFLHTAEVRGAAAYASALAEARLGIQAPAGDFDAVFSGNAGEENFFKQFDVDQRPGYLTPNTQFVALLEGRSDPRLADYFNPHQTDLSNARLAANFPQPLVTAQENLLVWAEAAQRGGNDGAARAQLDAERALTPGLAPLPSDLAGRDLLREILAEKYVALFQNVEVWSDYRRTCFPNLTPVVAGQKIPARLLYDTNERQTNTSIPPAQSQPTRNANDPANRTSDGTGEACLGQ